MVVVTEDFRGCFAGPKVKIHEIFVGGVNTFLLRATPPKKRVKMSEAIHTISRCKHVLYCFMFFLLPRYHSDGHLSNHPFNKTGPVFFSCHLHTAKEDACPEAGFHTFHEREAFRGLPQLRHDDVMLPEDVYEDLVPVLRKDVRAQWQQRMEAFCGEKGERMKNQSVILVLGLLFLR